MKKGQEPKAISRDCVYREVKLLNRCKRSSAVASVPYDEKPGVQATGATAPSLPEPGIPQTVAPDHEYSRHGTVSLLAGIHLLTSQVHSLVKDRHRSREFIEFLKLLDAAYPSRTAIKVILDNHPAHISKETHDWLDDQRAGRFEFAWIMAQSRRRFLLPTTRAGRPAPPSGEKEPAARARLFGKTANVRPPFNNRGPNWICRENHIFAGHNDVTDSDSCVPPSPPQELASRVSWG